MKSLRDKKFLYHKSTKGIKSTVHTVIELAIATGSVRDENINFESNRTSSVLEKKQLSDT